MAGCSAAEDGVMGPNDEPLHAPSGMLGGFSETPWARRISQDMKVAGE